MTSVCVGSVASRPKTGIPDRIYLDTNYMQSILPAPLSWMGPFLPYLPPIFVDVGAFCTAEPPAQPSLTEATMAAVLAGGELGASLVAAELILQEIQACLWYVICECSSGTQPTAPSPPSAPSGLVQINPPTIVVPPAPSPCLTLDGGSFTTGSTSSFVAVAGPVGVPPGATSMWLRTTHGAGTPHFDQVSIMVSNDTNFANAAWSSVSWCPGGVYNPLVDSVTPIAGKHYWIGTRLNTEAAFSATAAIDFYCGGATPGGPGQSPCCPPDPVMNGILAQILNYVATIQRQAAPFGYVYGTNHTALTGHGSFAVSGLIGVSVDVTTLPTSYGQRDGSPVELFDLGFVTLGTADGYEVSRRIDHDGSLVIPQLGGLYTAVGYSLSPGVAVSIRELTREP